MNIREVLEGQRIGLLSAHPDDHLTRIHTLRIAKQVGKGVEELVYNRGKKSTLNYRTGQSPPFRVDRGDRADEAEKAAAVLGIETITVLDGIDGGLRDEIATMVPRTVEWIREHKLDVLLTLGLTDHDDHLASGVIGRLAAAQVSAEDGRPVGVLEQRFEPVAGSMVTEATPDGMEQAYAAAKEHGSQFLLSMVPQHGWPIVPGGLFMHPASHADLTRYPIQHDDNHVFFAAGSLVLPQ